MSNNDSTVIMNNGRSHNSASACVQPSPNAAAVVVADVAAAAIEINRDYDNGEIMIGTDTNTIYDNASGDCTVEMRTIETCSVRQKKRKQMNATVVVTAAAAGAGGGDIDCAPYTIIERDCKRQKIEVKVKRINGNADTVNDGQVADNQMRPVKPPVPPKPKHLVCRPPQHILDRSKINAKLDTAHAVTVQKLSAQAEQLRHEITNLKAALSNERNAVRTLR